MAIEENNDKKMVKHLLDGNTGHMTYMLNYFSKSEEINKQITQFVVRNNIKMLLFIAPQPQQPLPPGMKLSRKLEFDGIIT